MDRCGGLPKLGIVPLHENGQLHTVLFPDQRHDASVPEVLTTRSRTHNDCERIAVYANLMVDACHVEAQLGQLLLRCHQEAKVPRRVPQDLLTVLPRLLDEVRAQVLPRCISKPLGGEQFGTRNPVVFQ